MYRNACVASAFSAAMLVACSGGVPDSGCPAPCPFGERCDAIARRCAPSAPDAGAPSCTTDRDCTSSAPRCRIETGLCVGCLSEGDCLSGRCTDFRCVPLPDTCQTAEALDLSPGSATVTGDTSRATNDTRAYCSASAATGPDLVFSFTLTEKRRLVAVARPEPGSSLRPVLMLKSACDPLDSSTNLGCSYRPTGAAETWLTVDGLSPGTYWLWLDSDGDSAGAFTLTLSAESPQPAESCASPKVIAPFKGELLLSGDTSQAKDDAAGSCGGLGAPDQVYALELAVAQRLKLELTSLAPSYYPALYLRRQPCESADPATQLTCVKAVPYGQPMPISVELSRLEAGTYYLFVDGIPAGGSGSGGGPFNLKLFVSDPLLLPTNDGCAGALALPVPSSGFGTVSAQGDTTLAVGDTMGTCGGSGPDVVYKLSLSRPTQLTASVGAATGSALRPVVYVRAMGKCGSELFQDQLACSVAPPGGSTATVTTPGLSPGEYYIWIDGYFGSKGAFALTVDLAAPLSVPSNDTCASPQQVPISAGYALLTGTTSGAKDDTTSCEFPSGSTAPDVVYAIDIPAKQALSVDLKAMQGSALEPVITLRPAGKCSSLSLADEVFCAWGDPQFPDRAVYNVGSIDPGTYFLWVDGDYATHGQFSLRVGLGPAVPLPPNDDCLALPLPALQTGVAVVGDTRSAADDGKGSCGGLAGASGDYAPDLVYQFSLGATKSVTVTVTPDLADGQLLRPVVYVRGPGSAACPSIYASDQKGCHVAAAYGGQAVLSLANLAPGSYYVWVDGAGHSSGKFSVKLQ
ncbi:MAG: hypothetical protein HYZ28_18085 [Myxococcales bacterium]|nr:hypothetical protein [Myxococcales bacterium]